MSDCQLESLPESGDEPGRAARVAVKVLKRLQRHASGILGLPIVSVSIVPAPTPDVPRDGPQVRHGPLGLAPGERVRVRPLEEIRATLDAQGRCGGVAYVPAMERFCGRSFVVRKRIGRFFDERTRRLLNARHVVILDGAFCEVGLADSPDYGGCDRTCFLFWKEDWLVREPGDT